jgi:hypothetical protein
MHRIPIPNGGISLCLACAPRASTSRSLSFVFSTLIWSTIAGVVSGMVAFRGFMSIAIDLSCV